MSKFTKSYPSFTGRPLLSITIVRPKQQSIFFHASATNDRTRSVESIIFVISSNFIPAMVSTWKTFLNANRYLCTNPGKLLASVARGCNSRYATGWMSINCYRTSNTSYRTCKQTRWRVFPKHTCTRIMPYIVLIYATAYQELITIERSWPLPPPSRNYPSCQGTLQTSTGYWRLNIGWHMKTFAKRAYYWTQRGNIIERRCRQTCISENDKLSCKSCAYSFLICHMICHLSRMTNRNV